MSVVVEPICAEIEYTYLGISGSDNNSNNIHDVQSSSTALDERVEEKRARSRRRTRAIARRIVKGVFKFPLCCRPSTSDDRDDDFAAAEHSKHIPYALRKVPEALNQLVPHKAPEVQSQHLPHVQRKVSAHLGSELQRKVVIFPPNPGSALQPMSTHGQWRIGFDNSDRWESPLQGWSLTGDAFPGVGEPGLRFECRGDAISYAQKYGWSFRVEGELENHKGNKPIGAFGWVELVRPAVRT